MNDLYFRCETCKRFVEAGYRHAYWTLVEPGVVLADDYVTGGTTLPPVSAEAVFAAKAYWAASANDSAIAEQLGRVRAFLSDHARHSLSFGDIHRLHAPADEWLGWRCDDRDGGLLPRDLVEGLRLSTWTEVEAYLSRTGGSPWWWSSPDARQAARRKFEELVRG